MAQAPLAELVAAVTGGLARPLYLWTLIVVLAAIAGAVVVARLVHRHTQSRLQVARADGAGAGVDALRFSIEGVRRLAFPLAAQALLWAGEAGLRLAGLIVTSADARLLRLAMVLFAAMAAVRLLIYALRRAFKSVVLLAVFERSTAAAIWALIALHLVGWLDGLVAWLRATSLPIGAVEVSLWTALTGVLTAFATLLAALWLGASIEARLMRAASLDSNVRAVVARVVRAALVLFAVLTGLSLIGFDLTVLSVFGGALGVGLGLGLQRIASNYVSGFIILLDRSLRIGDLITVDKYQGAVTQINTRYTVVRALDGTEAIVPNEMLVAQPVSNHSFSDRNVRLSVKVPVDYETDVVDALRIMEHAARGQPRVLAEPPPAAALLGFGADGLELEVGFWVADPERGRLNVQSAVAQSILAAFRAASIRFPSARADTSAAVTPPPASGSSLPARSAG